MLFNTLQFWVFFLLVYILYLYLPHRWQNRWLLLASYFFYGAWDWRFLSLLLTSTLVDYFCGWKIYHVRKHPLKKRFLLLSLFVNLSILGFFKYFHFFMESVQNLLRIIGLPASPFTLKIILPIGISFYTFQTLSYTLDIYYGKLKPIRNFLDFALFVAFFPQLVAGPIERAHHLIPQITSPRKVTPKMVNEGAFLILWGLFKKVVVADNLAKIVDTVFGNSSLFTGGEVLMSLYAFAMQVYCDFSGYSDIARGLGRCMGFDIMLNFNLPYFSTSLRELWRRWHISLSTWLRDYLYIPLGGNRRGKGRTCLNLIITMVLGGLWHGAAWNFVLWGFYHGILLAIHRLLYLSRRKLNLGKWLGEKPYFLIRVLFTFHLVCLGYLMFRANSLSQIGILLKSLFFHFTLTPLSVEWGMKILFFSGTVWIIQIIQFWKKDIFAHLKLKPLPQVFLYVYLTLWVIIFGVTGGQEFIYFQF